MLNVSSRKRSAADKEGDLICLSDDDMHTDDTVSVSSAFSTTKLRRGLELDEEPEPSDLHQNAADCD
ncbi:hypothetical protein AAVH_29810, partial [Aphelenchoides avenae]